MNNNEGRVIDFLYKKFGSIKNFIIKNPGVILYENDDSFFDLSDQAKLEGNYIDVFVKKFEKFESKYNKNCNQSKLFQYSDLNSKNSSIN